MKKIILSIDGMTCSACSNGLEKYLNKQDGVEEASVNLIMNNASILYDEKKLKLDDLDRFVKEAGFKSLGKYKLNFEEKQSKKEMFKLIGISVFSIITIILSMLYMFNWQKIDILMLESMSLTYGKIIALLSTFVLLLSFDIIKNGVKNLIHKTPNMDTLVTLGVLATYIFSVYNLFITIKQTSITNQNLYKCFSLFDAEMFIHKIQFETVCMILFFVKVGKYIEHKNINKTKEALQKLVTITPKDAVIFKDEDEIKVTIDEIKKDDIVICKPGEKIAVDGEIIERRNTH